MRILRVLRQRARTLFRGTRVDVELDNELAYHLDQLTRENIASGMTADEAHLAARRALGGMALIQEQCRDQRRLMWLTDLRNDLAYAWRMLEKSPGVTALCVLTLALGVGASIAVYALAESLLLRSLPYPSPERLVSVNSIHVRKGRSGVGQENFRDWQASNSVFERMAFAEFSQMTLTGQGDAERITGQAVSEGFFEMFGVSPQLGRWFTPEEQKPGADRVILLSRGFWLRKMEGRAGVVGSTLFLNDRPYRITGVMPAGFGFGDEYWTPIDYRTYGRRQHQYSAYARLKPGVTIRMAQSQMSDIGRRLEALPDNAGWGVRVTSLRSELLEPFGPALQIFAAAALIALLVACANVASLLLARGVGRSKEIAVRMALGAGRLRLVRLLLTESVLLSCLGAGAGTLVASWLLQLAIAAAPPWLQLGAMLSVSPSLAAFSVALALGTGILTGAWPALRGSRANPQTDLKESGASAAAGRRQMQVLNSLVVLEIALAVVLLTFAGLLTKSFAYLLHTDLGYRTDHLLTFRMPLPASRYPDGQARLLFWDNLSRELTALPGVISASAADSIPLGGTYSGVPVEVEGQIRRRDWVDVTTRSAIVTPDYFRTMGITLLTGRAFNQEDRTGAESALIVNETFLRNLMPENRALGARVRAGKGPWRRIVGVIRDLQYNGPRSSVEPEAYVPFAQEPYLQFVAIRTAVPEDVVLSAVRKVIRGLDPDLPITQVRTMRQSVDQDISLSRRMMVLVAGFGVITLGMAILGVAGVMAYAVSRRRREIGLRMALGARSSDVSRAVFRDAARLVFAGSGIGLLGTFAGTRVLDSFLYGVRPHDPLVIAAAPVVLGTMALLACIMPARRAASVEPTVALRQE
jgi:predicted permease